MEYINRITVRGIVGSARRTQFRGAAMTRFTVCTSHEICSGDGGMVIETEWHNVTAFDGKNIDAASLTRGCGVEVTGRIRKTHFTGADGQEKTDCEILASSVKPVSGCFSTDGEKISAAEDRPAVNGPDGAARLLRDLYTGRAGAAALFLDSGYSLLGKAALDRDTAREVIGRALALDARRIVTARFDPDGDTEPSAGEIAGVNSLNKICKALGISLADHVVMGKDEYYSFDHEAKYRYAK